MMQPGTMLQAGDIIGISETLYDHFGLYIGNDRLIHFTCQDRSKSKSQAKIQETGMDHFLADRESFFMVSAPEWLDAYRRWVDECVKANEISKAAGVAMLGMSLLNPLAGAMSLLTSSAVQMTVTSTQILQEQVVKQRKEILAELQQYSGETSVARAQSLIGKKGYNLFTYNCEHFAFWCRLGVRVCEQRLFQKGRHPVQRTKAGVYLIGS